MASVTEKLEKYIPLSTLHQSFNISPIYDFRNIEKSYTFERIDIQWWCNYARENRTWAYYAVGIYLLTIFGLQKHMENRKAFNLRVPLIWWNLGLGIFSIVGFVRSVCYLNSFVGKGKEGFYKSICVPEYNDPSVVFWG